MRLSTDIQRPMYSIAFRMHLDSAAAPHMVQITEIAVMCSPPLFGRVPSRVHGFLLRCTQLIRGCVPKSGQ